LIDLLIHSFDSIQATRSI